MLVGLMHDGEMCLLLNREDTGPFITAVLEISKLMSQLFSLPLFQEHSVSFFMFLSPASLVSLLLRADNCIVTITSNQDESMEILRMSMLNFLQKIVSTSNLLDTIFA